MRRVLDGADEALLGVAFVQQRGVNLLERQLATLGRGRLVATTAFGTTTLQGLETATARGLSVRVLNPSRGTFHPKLYVARHGDRIAAAIGSANLTGGLISNVEAVAVLSGEREAPALARLWELAESWWQHDDAIDWAPGRVPAAAEVLQPDLLAAIRAAVAADPIIGTLAERQPELGAGRHAGRGVGRDDPLTSARPTRAARPGVDDPDRLGVAHGARHAHEPPPA